ncbi:MAG: hypothetical protein QMC67_12575 [Candidatus Wallbacteria bacterium]
MKEFYFNLLDNNNNDSGGLNKAASGQGAIKSRFGIDAGILFIAALIIVNAALFAFRDSIALSSAGFIEKRMLGNKVENSAAVSSGSDETLVKYSFSGYKELEDAFNYKNFAYLNTVIEDSLKFARKVTLTPLTVMNLLESAHSGGIKIMFCEFMPQNISSKVKISGIALSDQALSEYCAKLSKMQGVADFKFNMSARKEKLRADDAVETAWIDFSIECEIKK